LDAVQVKRHQVRFPIGRLDGDVAKQKLDLTQFAAREVAETSAGAPQVV